MNDYLGHVAKYLKPHSPSLLRLEVIPSVIIPLNTSRTTFFGKPMGIVFIDSTKLRYAILLEQNVQGF
ncbi:MAG: hypothetical protein ACJAYB_000617 [Psychromonas sp.]|jgi:hypothetical protein